MPYSIFKEFVDSCKNDKINVFPFKKALKDAKADFNLKTKSELLDFISNNGLEDLNHVNDTSWRDNPDKANLITVHGYKFKSMYKLGYIAFFYNNKTKKWIIKSFHISDDSNSAMMIALNRARLLKRGGENE